MKNSSSLSLKKQRGFGLLQAALMIAIMAFGAVYAWRGYEEGLAATRSNSALEEVSRWLGYMTNIATQNAHVFTGLDADDVIAQTPISSATNLYGQTITVAVATNNWQFSYPFPDSSSCEYVEARVLGHPGLTTTAPACNASNVLVATVE